MSRVGFDLGASAPSSGRSQENETIHAFNKSGRHLEFSTNDVNCGKIIHVAKMATKDESSVDVDFAVCSGLEGKQN